MRNGNNETERDDRHGTVELRRQAPATADVYATLGDRTPTAVWRELFAPDGLRAPFIAAAREFATGKTVSDLYDSLDEIGLPSFLLSRVRDIAAGNRATACRTSAGVAHLLDQRFGVDAAVSIAELFAAVDVTPSVVIQLDAGFFERRREQREDVCRLLDALADGVDITVFGSAIELHRLATDHRADLAGVSDWCDRRRRCGPTEEALDGLDPESRPVEVLRRVAEEPGETISQSALYATATVSESRVRQCLSTLAGVGCIETYGSQQRRQVELTAAGREYLAETSRQVTLEAAVSDSVQSTQQCRVTPGKGEEGGQEAGPYRTAYLDRSSHAAAVGCGRPGAVTLVDDGAFTGAEDRTRYVSHDETTDDAVVAIRASTPLQYAVSLATALASPEFLDRAVPVDRLEELDEPASILRDARCIGGVSTEAEDDPQVLRDTLVKWGVDLAEMTSAMQRGEYEDRDRFRGEIMRSAHGLAGSLAHLLDSAGVSLTREIRVPRQLSDDQLSALAETVSYSLAIQSRYRSFAAFRQLYEDRPEKRKSAFSVDVDATDPSGTLIGSVVIRSSAPDRVGSAVGEAIRHRLEPHDDAPEFVVSIPVRRGGWQAYRSVTRRLADRKRLELPTDASRTLMAVTSSPYAAAEALSALETESFTREIEADELRYALSTLSPSRLADIPPTAQQTLSALLQAQRPVSQADLAELADVSTSSVRRHSSTLAGLGLVERTEAGYRCSLAFAEERGRDAPTISGLSPTAALDAVLLHQLPTERYADPEDALAGALFHPTDPWRVLDNPPADLAGWLGVAKVLATSAKSRKTLETDEGTVATIEFGEATDQQPVTAVGAPTEPTEVAE